LNGGGSFSNLFLQDTNPSPVDQSNIGENGLLNIPPLPNFDQMGLANVLDKFLPVDGSVRLPPPSNEPIIHSRENVPIPSIGQLGIDTSGLFGEGSFSLDAGSLSNTPKSPSVSTDSLSGLANNNDKIDLVNTPSESPSKLQDNLAPNTVSMHSERSADQKANDQLIWNSMIPPLPKDRNPIEVFPSNEPTPDPKRKDKKSKKRKPLLPLLPPSPTRKSSQKILAAPRHEPSKKDESHRISTDILLDNIPSIDQLGIDLGNIPPTSPSSVNINDNNLLENIPSINQLENDLFGSGIKNQGTKKNENIPKEPSSVGDIFQFPEQFSGGNRDASSTKKDQQNDQLLPFQTPGSMNLTTLDTDTNTTTLENLWKILINEVPGLGKLTGEEVPSVKPQSTSIEDLLGLSPKDIDAFDAKHNPTLPQDTRSSKNASVKPSLPAFSPTETSTVNVPFTTVSSLINIPTTASTPPTTPHPTTLPSTTTPTTSTKTTPKTAISTTPQPIVYNPLIPDNYLFPTNLPPPPEIYISPTKPSYEKTTTQIEQVKIDFKPDSKDTKKLLTSTDSQGGEPFFLPGDFFPEIPHSNLPSDVNMESNKTKSANNIPPMVLPSEPELPITTPFSILSIAPSISDQKLDQPKIEDMGIFNDHNERNPFTQTISKESLLPNRDYTLFGGHEQTMNTQSQTTGFESIFGNDVKEQNLNINNDSPSKGNKHFLQSGNKVERNSNSNSNSMIEPYIPTTATKPIFPALELLIGGQEEVKPTTVAIPKLPSVNLQILDGIGKGSDHEQSLKSIKDEPFTINIKNDEIKDVPPLAIDIFGNGFENLKMPVSTPAPSTSTLPSLPPIDFLNAINEPWNTVSESEGFSNKETGILSTPSPLINNEDELKQIINSGPKRNDQTFENSVSIPRSFQQNNELPFVAPTSEASKHFVFHDQLNGGNIRNHKIFNRQSTTPKSTETDAKSNKPNILVIDIVNKPAGKRDVQTGQQNLNSNNNGIIPDGTVNSDSQRTQQVTPTPRRATTPSWLASTILAIRYRLDQLRALRKMRQNNRNNNNQNAAGNHRANVISNQRQSTVLPSTLTLNPRNNGRLIQNLRIVNNQRSIGGRFPSQVNFNNFQIANRASPQNQPLVNGQQNAISQTSLQQSPQILNQLNRQNTQPLRQSIPSTGTQNSQISQNGATQAETERLREQIRQRIQRIIRTQLFRNLLIRRLQALRAQSTNNAQQTRNQPIWRVPTSSNNMNIMNANNAIHLIRQARQLALTASQQQQPNNQPSFDLSRNFLGRLPNRNIQNVAFQPILFGRQPPVRPIEFSRFLQNNRGLNFNNRIGPSLQRLVSNGTNGSRVNRDPRLDLSLPPSELALRTLQNLNLQRARSVRQGTSSNIRPIRNLVVERRAIPVSEAFQLIERLRAQNRDILPFRNFNPNNIPLSLRERFRNGLRRFQPVQNVPHSVFNRQRIVVPINGPLRGNRHNQNITRRPNFGQTSPPPQFTGPPGGWSWADQQNSDK
jgi:hypothetical protein